MNERIEHVSAIVPDICESDRMFTSISKYTLSLSPVFSLSLAMERQCQRSPDKACQEDHRTERFIEDLKLYWLRVGKKRSPSRYIIDIIQRLQRRKLVRAADRANRSRYANAGSTATFAI